MLRGWAGVGDCEGGTHVDLKGANKVAAHAGAATTLGEATHIDCLKNAYISDDVHHFIVEGPLLSS